ncbi:MAG TPA: diguanylate cyclase [Fimbriimonadaceae bacterium]|nr:diguanylate cyclase [Fimbriimonadaceae bacterium]
MSEADSIQKLLGLLRELGVRTLDDRLIDGGAGFPVCVPLEGGGNIVLDLPAPGMLSSLDPDGVGVAIIDPLGYVRRTWGVAKRIGHFKAGRSVLETPLSSLLEGSFHGSHGNLYLNGYRYFSAGLTTGELSDVFMLVINASEERQARMQASKSTRMAHALKRLGKCLTMNQQIQSLCNAAAHEIASVAELAAVLIWVNRAEDDLLELVSSVGVNRQGQSVLAKIAPDVGGTCVAELVAASRNSFHQETVLDHVLTSNLEAKFCYLRPGGVAVHPLVISDRLLGVLEIVGRDGDANFEENSELFETIAEHLALAINSAVMFENFERWASHDALTGLSNHRHLHEVLNQRVLEAKRTGQEIGLIMMDVDHFRSFNEEEGHDAGDEVLKLVADALRSCMRPYDLPGRYGGEEFIIVMPGCSLENALSTAERIRLKVEALPYTTRAGRERHVTVSLGCSVFPHTASDPSSLIKAADTALFEAKRAGRNRSIAYQGEFKGLDIGHQPQLDKVPEWIPDASRGEAAERLAQFEDEILKLAPALHLSPSQVEILRALVLIAPYYAEVRDRQSPVLEQMESAEEFRLLLPSLHSLEERFDGEGKHGVKGSRIPLLGRVLAVLFALDKDKGREIIDDPRKFDPEIVSLLLEIRHAA